MTPVEAAQTIYAVLAADPSGPVSDPVQELLQVGPPGKERTVNKVYLIEPRPGVLATPISITVSVDGMTALQHQSTVRVYGKLSNLDAVTLQQNITDTWTVIEGLLDQTSIWARGDWANSYVPELDALVASCPMVASREDLI